MVDEHVKAANAHLPPTRRLYIALLNGPRNVIVAGDPVRCAPACATVVITKRTLTPARNSALGERYAACTD